MFYEKCSKCGTSQRTDEPCTVCDAEFYEKCECSTPMERRNQSCAECKWRKWCSKCRTVQFRGISCTNCHSDLYEKCTCSPEEKRNAQCIECQLTGYCRKNSFPCDDYVCLYCRRILITRLYREYRVQS